MKTLLNGMSRVFPLSGFGAIRRWARLAVVRLALNTDG